MSLTGSREICMDFIVVQYWESKNNKNAQLHSWGTQNIWYPLIVIRKIQMYVKSVYYIYKTKDWKTDELKSCLTYWLISSSIAVTVWLLYLYDSKYHLTSVHVNSVAKRYEAECDRYFIPFQLQSNMG